MIIVYLKFMTSCPLSRCQRRVRGMVHVDIKLLLLIQSTCLVSLLLEVITAEHERQRAILQLL